MSPGTARTSRLCRSSSAATFSLEDDEARRKLAKDPGNGLLKYQVVFGEGHGVAWELSETWNCQIGYYAQTAEEWATKNLIV